MSNQVISIHFTFVFLKFSDFVIHALLTPSNHLRRRQLLFLLPSTTNSLTLLLTQSSPLRSACLNHFWVLNSFCNWCVISHSLHSYRLFGTQEVRHNYNTRFSNNNNLNMHLNHSSTYRCSFYANGIKHWNNLPCQIQSARSKFCFKRKLRLHLSESLYITGQQNLTISKLFWQTLIYW